MRSPPPPYQHKQPTRNQHSGLDSLLLSKMTQYTPHTNWRQHKTPRMRTKSKDVIKVCSSTFVLELVLVAEGGVVDGCGGVCKLLHSLAPSCRHRVLRGLQVICTATPLTSTSQRHGLQQIVHCWDGNRSVNQCMLWGINDLLSMDRDSMQLYITSQHIKSCHVWVKPSLRWMEKLKRSYSQSKTRYKVLLQILLEIWTALIWHGIFMFWFARGQRFRNCFI